MLVFRRGKPGGPGEKPLGARERTNNKLISHMVSSLGFDWATLVGGECSHHCATLAPAGWGDLDFNQTDI